MDHWKDLSAVFKYNALMNCSRLSWNGLQIFVIIQKLGGVSKIGMNSEHHRFWNLHIRAGTKLVINIQRFCKKILNCINGKILSLLSKFVKHSVNVQQLFWTTRLLNRKWACLLYYNHAQDSASRNVFLLSLKSNQNLLL